MIFFLSLACSSGEKDTAKDSDMETGEEGAAEECQTPLKIQLEEEELSGGDQLYFGTSPALGDPIDLKLTLENTCSRALSFLGNPDDWISGPQFELWEYPPVMLDSGETGQLTIRHRPGEQGDHPAELHLTHDRDGSPFKLSLQAESTAPLKLTLIGDGLRVATTEDYGLSFAHDSVLPGQPGGRVSGICHGGGRFIAVGGIAERRYWSSLDGVSWTSDTEVGEGMRDCAFGNNIFVSFDQAPLRSIAGLQWESGASTPWMHDPLESIVFGEDVFVAVGGSGRVASTTEGMEWESDHSIGTFDLHSVTWGNGLFVTAGDFGFVARSEDGIAWESQVVGQGIFQRAVHGDGIFLISNGSELYASEDAELWTLVNEDGVKPITSLGSMFFGTKEQDLYKSTDRGQTWTLVHSFGSSQPFKDAEFAGD